MSDPVFFPARLNCKHATLLSSVVGRMQAGQPYTPTPEELVELGNLAGAINMWANDPNSPCIKPEMRMHDPIARGDFSRKTWQAEVGVVDVFPFVHPGPPFNNGSGTYYMSVAEYQGDPWLRQLTVSATAGDMNGTNTSTGKQATVYMEPNSYPPGTQLYANILLKEDAPPGKAGSGFSIVWP